MALNTYAELQTAVANWLNRDDLTARIPEFIALSEARIRRNQHWFKQIYSTANAGLPFTVSAQPMSLPTYVKEIIALWASSSTYQHDLDIVTPEAWRTLAQSNRNASGVPTVALIAPQMDTWLSSSGAKLYLWPQPSGNFDIDFQFIRDLDPLATVTNALFLRHPDLYLYGALAESAPFLQHDERLPMWEQRFKTAETEITSEAERAQYSASAKRIRLPRSF